MPEAIQWITSTGSEGGDPAVPRIGREHSGPVVLGSGFTGFLDELRISRRFVEDPALQRFLGRTGTAVSSIVDLRYSGTRISRIEAVTSEPGDSAVELSLPGRGHLGESADTEERERLGPLPSLAAASTIRVRGRYVQVMVELFPDGTRTRTPRVSSIRIVYEPNVPPVPPAGLTASAGQRQGHPLLAEVHRAGREGVHGVLRRRAAHVPRARGHRPGDSPIDVGEATRIEIGGLANGSLYYFAVVAYDSSQPRQQSAFSTEVSARPSRIYK